MIGCHSVMESPEPVSRVAPPTLTITNTSAATANSHTRTGSMRCVAVPRAGANVCCCAMQLSCLFQARASAAACVPGTIGATRSPLFVALGDRGGDAGVAFRIVQDPVGIAGTRQHAPEVH